MANRPYGIAVPLVALALAGLLATAGPATAIYIVTPLTLSPGESEAEVGDTLDFTVGPNREHENGTAYAGRALNVRYQYDPHEGQEPNGSAEQWVLTDREVSRVTLDASSQAAFTWTVPAEVDDRNVWIQIVDDAGEILATAHVRVGDAAPIMAIMAGNEAAQTGPVEETPLAQGEEPAEDEGGRDVPALGAIAIVGAAVVALAILRRR